MTADFRPTDQEARDRIRDSLEETLFVEAGAGTGKTTSLVDRVMSLARSGAATMDRPAVITFTTAAASELRDRIRERLERLAAPGSASSLASEELERVHRALDDLDRSYIQTVHSFSLALLRERPLEAGLPPAFETMDAIEGDLFFEESWSEWVDRALDAPELRSDLELAFSFGLTLGQLREIALAFHQDYDLLENAAFPVVPIPVAAAVAHLKDAVPELERLGGYSRIGDGDRLYDHVRGVLRSIDRLGETDPGESSAYRTLQRALPIRQRGGRQGDWDTDPVSGANACAHLKERLADLHETVSEELAQVRLSAFNGILRALRKFTLDSVSERKTQGRAGFQDLLVWARDLLRDNTEVRDHFRQRFSHILIDEAQDTDPIQAEIAMFIAEDDPPIGGSSHRPRHWQQVKPKPGKLFVVGDPKQSIYRFRRADVDQMYALRDRMGGETLHLRQNFRSQSPVMDWVNAAFDTWMPEGFRQADYLPLAPRWEADTDHPLKPRVWRLGGEVNGAIAEVREEEAEYIAGLLGTIAGGQWQVLDPGLTEEAGAERYRAAALSDVCILMTRRTGLRTLELAIEGAGIPYRLEGASLIFDTQEIRDLLNCLKAIDDPADQVATVAALRSPAFACSDVDLLRFSELGGSFDYLAEVESIPSGDDNPVPGALEMLRRFHNGRMWTSLAALIDGFIRDRMLMQAAMDHPRTREQWRRYRFMVEQARAFAEAGGDSLRAFLQWVERQAAEGARVNESPAPETDEDAVKIMTVHASKGLEFPIVILTGLNSTRRSVSSGVLFDRDTAAVEAAVGSGDNRFETPGHESLRERESRMGDDEAVRLIYVATTRARDHLVLSMYRGSRGGTYADKIAAIFEGRDDLWEPVPATHGGSPAPAMASSHSGDSGGHSLEERERWRQHREELLARLGRPVSVGATGMASVAKEEPRTDEPWRKGRGGTSLGRAVHSVLQTVDLVTGSGIDHTARAQAAAEGIPGRWAEVARLARVAVESQIVQRATASRFWREAPVAIPVGDGVLEGFGDLMFEEDGGLVLVDYKTDAVDSVNIDEALSRYQLQGGAYALAVENATGIPVKEVVFLFLHANTARSLTDIPDLAARAAAAAAESLGTASSGVGSIAS